MKKTVLKLWTENCWKSIFPETYASLVKRTNGKTVEESLTAVEQQISNALTGVYKYAGQLASYEDLPTDAPVGTVYEVVLGYAGYEPGTNWVWNGINWDPMSSNLSNKSNATNLENGEGKDSIVQKVSTPDEPNGFSWKNIATGPNSIALGVASKATNYRALAIGNQCEAHGNGAIALSQTTVVTGNAAFGQGRGNTNAGECSVVMGENNTVKDISPASATFGKANTNDGGYSLIAGRRNLTNSEYGLTWGLDNRNYANYSLVGGLNNKNNAGCALVTGRYNLQNAQALVIVGNGTSDNHRKNALVAWSNGRLSVYGAPAEEDDAVRLKELNEAKEELRTELGSGGNNYVTLNGDQTITGTKTFTGKVIADEIEIQSETANLSLSVLDTTNGLSVTQQTGAGHKARYAYKSILYSVGGGTEYALNFPKKTGTLALVEDINDAKEELRTELGGSSSGGTASYEKIRSLATEDYMGTSFMVYINYAIDDIPVGTKVKVSLVGWYTSTLHPEKTMLNEIAIGEVYYNEEMLCNMVNITGQFGRFTIEEDLTCGLILRDVYQSSDEDGNYGLGPDVLGSYKIACIIECY